MAENENRCYLVNTRNSSCKVQGKNYTANAGVDPDSLMKDESVSYTALPPGFYTTRPSNSEFVTLFIGQEGSVFAVGTKGRGISYYEKMRALYEVDEIEEDNNE